MYPDQFIERIAEDYIGADKLVPMPFNVYLEYRWNLEQRIIREYQYTGEPI